MVGRKVLEKRLGFITDLCLSSHKFCKLVAVVIVVVGWFNRKYDYHISTPLTSSSSSWRRGSGRGSRTHRQRMGSQTNWRKFWCCIPICISSNYKINRQNIRPLANNTLNEISSTSKLWNVAYTQTTLTPSLLLIKTAHIIGNFSMVHRNRGDREQALTTFQNRGAHTVRNTHVQRFLSLTSTNSSIFSRRDGAARSIFERRVE